MVTVKINNKEVTVEDGTLILDAARQAGYEIPTFCYQAGLMGIGSCRICLVEIEGQKKLQPSCITPVIHGMSVHTETPTVTSARASMLEFLLANHALDCPVCDKAGECELQDMVFKFGPHKGRHAEKKFKFHEKDYALSPVIIKNSNRCVQCMRCVRVCGEVVGANVLGALGRGDHTEQSSFLRTTLECDQDGNCIEVCPVGCFMRLPYRYKTRPWDLKGADTICPYCATGCRMFIEQRDGVVMRAKAQFGVGINSETLCVRGRFGYDFVNSPERLTTPLVRRYGRLEPATWDEAFRAIREGLGGLSGEAIGGIASARATNEELYVFQRLMRGVFKSQNLDSSSRWDASSADLFIDAMGLNDGGASVFDCMSSDAVLIIGSNLTDENPVSDYIVRRVASLRRMNVIIASPRAMRLDSSATQTLRHLPSGESALLSAIALCLAEGNDAVGSIEGVRGLKEKGIDAFLNAAGVTRDEVMNVAKRLSAALSVGIFAGTDFLRFPHGNLGLKLLRAALKALGKKVLAMPALDRCNQRGAWDMGVHPGFGPGFGKSEKRGMGIDAMMKAAETGDLQAFYVFGSDVLAMYPDHLLARTALSKLKFLVVQDIFLTETASLAHVVLPGASFAEKAGTFTNQEGRVQMIKRLLPSPANARDDIEIISQVALVFDRLFPQKNQAGVFEEIRAVVPAYRAVSLAFNNKRTNTGPDDIKEALTKAFDSAPEPLAAGPELDISVIGAGRFSLVTGNHLFHSGRFTRKSETLLGLLKGSQIEIGEEDAISLNVGSGEKVKVRGADFEAVFSVKVVRGTRRGVAFIGENFEDAPVNRFFKRGDRLPAISITKA